MKFLSIILKVALVATTQQLVLTAQSAADLERKANLGDGLAMYKLAETYEQGRGVLKSFEKALNWYRRSAESGYTVAQLKLATIYEQGKLVSKDMALAYAWYSVAAYCGRIDAKVKRDRIEKAMTSYNATQAQTLAEKIIKEFGCGKTSEAKDNQHQGENIAPKLTLPSGIFDVPNVANTPLNQKGVKGPIVKWDQIELKGALMYIRGKKEPFTGVAIQYYENGSKRKEIPYVDGQRHGTATCYFKDGSAKTEKWVRGTGTAISYYEDGSKRVEFPVRSGLVHGTSIEYNRDGSKKMERVFKNGKNISEKKFFASGIFDVPNVGNTPIVKANSAPKKQHPNLVAYYPFNGNANDQSKNDRHGEVKGGTFVDDRFGRPNSAMYLRKNDWIYFPPSETHLIDYQTKEYTFSAWVKNYKGELFGEFFLGGTGVRANISTNYESYGIGVWFYPQSKGNPVGHKPSSIPRKIDGWYSIQVRKKSGPVSYTFAINGSILKKVENPNRFAGKRVIQKAKASIGRHANYNGYHGYGFVDQLRFYNIALSDEQLMQIFKDESNPALPN